MRLRSAWTLLFCLLVLITLIDSASACEGCKRLSATATGQSVKMVQASFSWSVLFLLGMPMVLLGWLVRLMVNACRAADARVNISR